MIFNFNGRFKKHGFERRFVDKFSIRDIMSKKRQESYVATRVFARGNERLAFIHPLLPASFPQESLLRIHGNGEMVVRFQHDMTRETITSSTAFQIFRC